MGRGRRIIRGSINTDIALDPIDAKRVGKILSLRMARIGSQRNGHGSPEVATVRSARVTAAGSLCPARTTSYSPGARARAGKSCSSLIAVEKLTEASATSWPSWLKVPRGTEDQPHVLAGHDGTRVQRSTKSDPDDERRRVKDRTRRGLGRQDRWPVARLTAQISGRDGEIVAARLAGQTAVGHHGMEIRVACSTDGHEVRSGAEQPVDGGGSRVLAGIVLSQKTMPRAIVEIAEIEGIAVIEADDRSEAGARRLADRRISERLRDDRA